MAFRAKVVLCPPADQRDSTRFDREATRDIRALISALKRDCGFRSYLSIALAIGRSEKQVTTWCGGHAQPKLRDVKALQALLAEHVPHHPLVRGTVLTLATAGCARTDLPGARCGSSPPQDATALEKTRRAA